MKQEINAYKQKYVQAIEEKDREVSGMFIIEMEHNMCMYMFYMYDWIYKNCPYRDNCAYNIKACRWLPTILQYSVTIPEPLATCLHITHKHS